MSRLIPVPAIAAGTWASGVADAAALPASGNALYDCRVALAEETIYIWTGSAWVGIAGGGGGGVTTVGAFSGSAQTNGAAISGTTITFGPASATVPGMVSTGAQVWAGAKTFNAAPIMAALTASLPVVTDGSKGLASVSYATFLASLGAAPTASPTFTGTVTLPSGSVTSSAWNTGTSTFTSNGVAFTAKAPLASPTFTGTVTMPDAGTWTSTGIQLADAKKLALGGLSTRFIAVDAAYDSNNMRFAMPTAGAFTYTINGTTAYFQITSQETAIYHPSTGSLRFGTDIRLGYSMASAAPTPPSHAYFKDIWIDTGLNTTIGTATLVGGTVQVNTNKVLTGDRIFISRDTPGGTLGEISAPVGSIVNATSFVINSTSALDTSTVNWWIIHTF